MFEDILGPRKKPSLERKIDMDSGQCFQCHYMGLPNRKPTSIFVLCRQLKKYVHSNQVSCILFKRKKTGA